MECPEIIIVTSDEPWCDIWHTQLHYTFQLSKQHRVFFIGPPDRWNPIRWLNDSPDIIKVSDNLTLLSYRNYFPARFGIIAMWINDFFNELRIKRIAGENFANRHLLMWRFDHFRGFYLFRNKKNSKELFHVIDPIMHARYNELFAKSAELVLVTSPKFLESYLHFNPNTILVPQGIDLDSYNTSVPDLSIHGIAVNAIVLLGTLSDSVDYLLLYRIAERFPEQLVVIGPDRIVSDEQRKEWERVLNSNNMRWLGAMRPTDFIPYLKVCRLGLICYSSTGKSDNNLRSPLKVISYLAAGKMVISNIDCEIPELENVAIHIVNNPDLVIERIADALSGKLDFDKESVGAYLRKIEYKNLIRDIFIRLNYPDN